VAKTSELSCVCVILSVLLLAGLPCVGIVVRRNLCCVANCDKDVLATHGSARAYSKPSRIVAHFALDWIAPGLSSLTALAILVFASQDTASNLRIDVELKDPLHGLIDLALPASCHL